MARVLYENVTKNFGDVVAVNNLNLDIPDREFVVLLGPSGCGKTTTLRLLAGLDELTAGNVYIGDRLVNDVAPKDRDIAMVFQSYALYPHMSVYDNMAFGLKLHKVPRAEIKRRVHEAARSLGIEGLLDRKPKELSGGQRQRVAVGRAITRDPRVFLMDEPLSNLDAKLRVRQRAELSKLWQRLGTTWIYVTHDQTEAMTMGTRIALMRDGILQQYDTPQNLYDHPTNLFVAGFVGAPSMNFFDVTLVEEDSALYADGGTFKLEVPEDKRRTLLPYKGEEVILGLRPENLYDPRYIAAHINEGKMKARVDVTELMGNEIFVYLVAGGNTFIARVDPRSDVQSGDEMEVSVDLDYINVFDRRTESAIMT
ncbi:MAG: ABC transporter ATP-binding protein [Chloroflexota bacterium]|nr:ABC transporter ATP-binding protein [Chloroflexota bacterium]